VTLKLGVERGRLTLQAGSRTVEEATFLVSYSDGQFSGQIVSSDYIVGSPVAFFEGMAADWHGWKGERRWSDLEGGLVLRATADSVGHISIRIEMDRHHPPGRLVGEIILEAGQLDTIAAGIGALFPHD